VRVLVNAVATEGMLGDLNPLGDAAWPIMARVCQMYCPRRNLKASSLSSSLIVDGAVIFEATLRRRWDPGLTPGATQRNARLLVGIDC